MITPALVRAARALINAKQSELADAAGISLATLNNIERDVALPRHSTMQALENVFIEQGIEFESERNGMGLRLQPIARAASLESSLASKRILSLMGKQSLMRIRRLVFFIGIGPEGAMKSGKSIEHQKPNPHAYLGVFIEGGVRCLLFDQTKLTMDNPLRAAESCGLLLAAKLLFPEQSFMIRHPLTELYRYNAVEAVDYLHSHPQENLRALVIAAKLRSLEALRGEILPIAEHPLHRLIMLEGEHGLSSNQEVAGDDQGDVIAALAKSPLEEPSKPPASSKLSLLDL